jgi:hypothetical protein
MRREKYVRNVSMRRAGEPAEVGRAGVVGCSGAVDFGDDPRP